MRSNQIDQKLQQLLLKPKGQRSIRRVKLSKLPNVVDAQLVDNLYAARQFLLSEKHSKLETVVNYSDVEEIEI